jgi:phage shock protein E
MLRRIAVALALAAGIWLGATACSRAPAVQDVTEEQVLTWIDSGEGPVIVDTRTQEEYDAGHVPGALHIPYDEMAKRSSELDAYRDRGVVVYCERGGRAAKAAAVLVEQGFPDVRHLEGDMSAWRENKRPVEK